DESVLELFKKRRSIRAFKTDPIEDEAIEKIVECVRWAPSGMNTQPWEVVVVKDAKLKDDVAGVIAKALEEMMKNMPARPYGPLDFANAPVFILLFADSRIKKYMPPMDDALWRGISSANMTLGFYNMLLAATTLGLGAQWMSVAGMPAVANPIKKLLDIPEYLESFAMIALGHPDGPAPAKSMREAREMVHYNKCSASDFRSEDDIKKFFGR
ncbi:MAG: nitroreductase family protein, partial [Desulfatitalea sp.]|nr:nitroreductase family protein [Desulfatitalea sp.]NNK02618.1 nitroreductase family protein [Desulfatitalea sp.]